MTTDHDVDHFLQFLKAQDQGYPKSFQEYSSEMWPRDLTMEAVKEAGLPDEDIGRVLGTAGLSEEDLSKAQNAQVRQVGLVSLALLHEP